ncbi:MAG: DUF6904 family protein [Sciscionella sp.]
MLTFDLIGKCAGIVLCNDYLSLRQMHRIVHDANERSDTIRDKEGFLLTLAYDLRKAYEGQRSTAGPDHAPPESGPRFGVEILWPTFLIQVRLLREALAFMVHTKEHQAVVFELEFLAEQAIEAEFKDKAAEIKREWESLAGNHRFMEATGETRVAQFAAWNEKQRRDGLAGLLTSMNSMYAVIYPHWLQTGVSKKRHLIAPEDFEVWKEREFPDPQI